MCITLAETKNLLSLRLVVTFSLYESERKCVCAGNRTSKVSLPLVHAMASLTNSHIIYFLKNNIFLCNLPKNLIKPC